MPVTPPDRPSAGAAPPATGEDRGTSEVARSEARDLARTGRAEAAKVAGEARSQTTKLVGEAGEQARQRAETQVGHVAGLIDQMATELDDMATGSSNPDGHLAGLARDGAASARRVSQRLSDDGLDGALDDVKRFARRRPGLFLATAFGVGLALGRVTRNADLGRINELAGDATSDDGKGAAARAASASAPTGQGSELPARGSGIEHARPTR